jgi:hypothetical protein
MPETIRVPGGSFSLSSFFLFVRHIIRNIFETGGFESASNHPLSHHRKPMLRSSHSWGIFPALPRDYIRRRRAIRRISNVVIVVLLSLAVAYAIVHISGPAPFSAPHH